MQRFERILEGTKTLRKEYVPTANSLFRVLAEGVRARTSLPEKDIAATDGYAVRHADLHSFPATLKIAGQSSSARPFDGVLGENLAVKVYAGGRMPVGADSVAAMSYVEEKGGFVEVNQPPVLGENICPAGIDFTANEESIKAGTVMTARLVGLASTMHVLWVPVVRRPRVAVLAIGSELAMPGEASVESPITASSLYSFSADITAAGGEPVILGISDDSLESIRARIREAEGCDMLVTTGGTSASAGNLMQSVLEGLAGEAKKFTVELNRNDYMLYAALNEMPICSLPGNPISSRIYFSLFANPLITRLGGMKPPAKTYAILGRTVDEHDTRMAYLHASLSVDESGAYKVIPVSAQDGFLLSELAKSHCLMVVNQNKALKKGDLVEVIPYGRGVNNT